MRHRSLVLLPAAVVLASGCATVIHGTRQDVGISSTPTNARVIVDNQQRGTTPTIAKLSRKDHHIVRIELDGYQPFEAILTRKVSGWVWGNLVFGNVVGLAVDAISGGLYKLTPEQIQGQLNHPQSGTRIVPTTDGVYVVLVARADADWSKLGDLQR